MMKKKSFVTLLIAVLGGTLFALGMCMALIPKWGVTTQGVGVGILGGVVLLVTALTYFKTEGKLTLARSARAVGIAILGIIGALALGTGLSMVMAWSMLLPGIAVGMLGIVLLICLIPATVGLK